MSLDDAVFPSRAGGPHYESYYLRAVDPQAPRGIWLRYTIHQRPGEEPTASLWVVLFQHGQPPLAMKQTFAAAVLGHGDGDHVRIDLSLFRPGRVKGMATGIDGTRASWDLAFTGVEQPLHHLPREWMYTAKLPRTKTLSPNPSITVDGQFTFGSTEVRLDGWRGMTGHNWGTEHAERWLWLNGLAFAEDEHAWFDVAIGRLKVGSKTTPWVGNGGLSIDGARHRLGGLERTRSILVDERHDGVRFVLVGHDIRVEGAVDAGALERVAWRYADPEGGEHHAINCSIAAVTLHVRTPDGERVLHSPHGGVFELGTRATDHGVPVQPYSDG